LYNEEIHLLGRSDILDFDGLEDKRVAVGEEGSGTYLTAKLLFELSEINPREMLTIGREEALSQLKSGKIDAMFYVAGFPVKLFADDVTEKDGLALIPITHKSILEFYPQGEIPPNTYKWQKQAVKTAAVKAVLVSFDFKSIHCDSVGKFAKLVSQNLDWLMQHGHPKWKNVDFNYSLKGWEQYGCVRKYLGKPASLTPKRSADENPVWRVVKEAL
jgi:TRAP transporter TAXI family solute receptor